MKFLANEVEVRKAGKKSKSWALTTSWKGGDDKIGSVLALPVYLLLPLYSKIRIHFAFIKSVVLQFDCLLRKVLTGSGIGMPDSEWDIFLTQVNDLKRDLFLHAALDPLSLRKILTEPMPRFIWRAILNTGDRRRLELLFDATDVEQGNFFLAAIVYDPADARLLHVIGSILTKNKSYQIGSVWRILEWFAGHKP
jgi:hypothetical protein